MRVTTSEGWSTERDLTVPQPGRTLQSASAESPAAARRMTGSPDGVGEAPLPIPCGHVLPLRLLGGTVEVLEDIPSNLPMDRAIREKHGIPVAADGELAASLVADNRVLLAVTPAKPASAWSVLGVEA